MPRTLTLLLGTCAIWLGGAAADGGGTTDVQERAKPPAKRLPAFKPPKTVQLKDVTPKQLAAFIKKQKGRAVLVDYWATWCRPCKKAFPHTVALSAKYAKAGLVVVSLCVDSQESRANALKFLKTSKAKIVNFYPNEKLDPDSLDEAFNASSFPLYRIYGADGKLVKAVTTAGKKPDQAKKEIDAAVLTALGYK